MAAAYEYEPFGGELSSPSEPENPMLFTGEYLDETGLYHLRARQYAPSSGRFLSADPLPNPIMDPCSSAFVYSTNRPTLAVDPSGLRHDLPVWKDFVLFPRETLWLGLRLEGCIAFQVLSPTAETKSRWFIGPGAGVGHAGTLGFRLIGAAQAAGGSAALGTSGVIAGSILSGTFAILGLGAISYGFYSAWKECQARVGS